VVFRRDDEVPSEATAVRPGAADRQPRLLLVGKGSDVVTHDLPTQGVLTVGRGPEATVRVDDRSVSRIHLRIHIGTVVRVEDLGSANGTKVGGSPLPPGELRALPPGHVVEIGTTWMTLASSSLSASSSSSPDGGKSQTLKMAAFAEPALVVHDERMRALHHLLERVAASDLSVLLYGETGVGKEVFARRLHELSKRARSPFIGINCAALTETLLESELFGHERGAFTGAVQAKPGVFEMAEKGTILLDEIGEVSPSVQVKLLRVLEERQVLRLGATKPRPIDVRVLSATNRNLEAAIDAGGFRRDLYFRLNGITLEIPPLRERLSEVEPLARRFIVDAVMRTGRSSLPEVAPEVFERLRRYRWPGNIRQLRNVIERAVVLAGGGPITSEALQVDTYVGPMPAPPPPPAPAAVEEEVDPSTAATSKVPMLDDERASILRALQQCAGNQTRAAELLGISRRTLVSRLAEYNLPRPRKR
jgi:transcriptional regulator with PAS, ATPase and Fis domain